VRAVIMELPPMPVGIRASLSFHCPGCGRELFAPLEAAGEEGPCPGCGGTVRAPVPGGATPAPAKAGPPPAGNGSRQVSKGTLADGSVDQGHVERRESIHLLRILLAVLLVAALCTVVVLALKGHISR
jgi:hypothetical protein